MEGKQNAWNGEMDMLNVIGLFLVAATTTSFGMIYARGLRIRVRVMESILLLITHIRVQIDGFRTPLRELYCHYHDAVLSETGILEALRLGGFTVALPRIRMYMEDEDVEILERLEEQLGKTSTREQMQSCLQAEQSLSTHLASEKEALPQRMRLYTTLGVCCGILLDIILI